MNTQSLIKKKEETEGTNETLEDIINRYSDGEETESRTEKKKIAQD